MIPFGFSVGDFISGIVLIKNSIDALKDTKGATKEYQELKRGLTGLEHGLNAIIGLDLDSTDQNHSAIEQAVRSCQLCIDTFLKNNCKYDGLTTDRTQELSLEALKTNLRKIRWAVCKKEDLAKFRSELQMHSEAIQMQLAVLQTKKASEQEKKQEDIFRSVSKQQTLAQESNTILKHVVMELPQSIRLVDLPVEAEQRKDVL
jgi:hypothetical protein